ncbi:MAG: 50S ribosomal protein L25 [Akkermansia sp.]
MATQTLKATKREVVGTGKLNALRAQDIIPAVIYGTEVEGNINIQATKADVRNMLNAEATANFIVNIDLDGTTIMALVKDIQRNFLTDAITHIDFLAVTENTVVKTKTPLKLVGTPVGVAMGGVVHQIVHEIPVQCAVKDIPCCITADISAVEYKTSFRLGQVELPANIKTPFNGTVVLCSVIKP